MAGLSVRRRFLENKTGVSAIEFSLIAPLLIILFMGLGDLCTAVMTQLHVDHSAEGTADLTSEMRQLQQSDMANLFSAASNYMEPYSGAPMNIRITNIYYDGNTSHAYGQVYWSCGQGALPPYTAKQQFTTLPGSGKGINYVLWVGNATAINTSVIVVEASYTFTSPTNYIIKGTTAMTSSAVLQPRASNYIGFPWSGSATSSPTAPASTTTTGSATLTNGATCNYAT
jgi:Flp pilus assembly protein TadG